MSKSVWQELSLENSVANWNWIVLIMEAVNLCILWPHNYCAKCSNCNCKFIYYHAATSKNDGKTKLKLKLRSQNSQKVPTPKARKTKTLLKGLTKKWQIFFCEKLRFLLHILEEIRKWEKVFESNPKSTLTILFLLATICPMRKFESFCVMNSVSY